MLVTSENTEWVLTWVPARELKLKIVSKWRKARRSTCIAYATRFGKNSVEIRSTFHIPPHVRVVAIKMFGEKKQAGRSK